MVERAHHPVFARLWERAFAPVSRRRGAEGHRRRLLDSLAGRVVEVGAGQGTNFALFPASVDEVLAVEPEGYLLNRARRAAASAPVPIGVVEGVAERIPAGNASFDAGVVALVLCSVADQDRALAELYRVIRPGGELRFYEHVIGDDPLLARFLRFADATFWPRAFGGCRPVHDTSAAIERAGFWIEELESFSFAPVPLSPPLPHILGRARRPE